VSGPYACVTGYRIAYSRSPMLHGYWLKSLGIEGSYGLADIAPPDYPAFLRNLRQNGYVGCNVTVPHKESAFRTVEKRDAAATAIGAVNTIWYEGDTLAGSNSDAYGFLAHLDTIVPGWDKNVRRAVVLGAGGAARGVVYALLTRIGAVQVVNRTPDRAHDLAAHFGVNVSAHDFKDLPQLLPQADLLVNATSLGALGNAPLAIDLHGLKTSAIVYDIVYVPLETELLKAARARGHRTVDGLGMLLHQGVPGFARWFGVTPPVTAELRALIEADIKAKGQ
jgi:shikimate dehydrogenase